MSRIGYVDVTGKRFGKLLAIKQTANIGHNPTWLCQCDCGNRLNVKRYYLLNGRTISCGCYRRTESIILKSAKKLIDSANMKQEPINSNFASYYRNRWRVYICCFKRSFCVGTYDSQEVAIIKRAEFINRFIKPYYDLVLSGKENAKMSVAKVQEIRELWNAEKTGKAHVLTGVKFGRLTALKRDGYISTGKIAWLCKCDCGNMVRVYVDCLIQGNTSSCGCLKSEDSALRGFALCTGPKLNSNNTSGVKGVSFERTRNKWRAAVRIGGRRLFLGSYPTVERGGAARKFFIDKFVLPFHKLVECGKADHIISIENFNAIKASWRKNYQDTF